MADHAPHRYLICYDIASPRRLAKTYRTLWAFAIPVQYSVFVTRMDKTHLIALLNVLRKIVDEKEDDVRAYLLPENGSAIIVGSPRMAEGVDLLEEKCGFDRLIAGTDADSEVAVGESQNLVPANYRQTHV